jgi:inorganic pyrophosphatase
MSSFNHCSLTAISAFSKPGLFNVVIETPKHSRNKFKYIEDGDYMQLKKVLPEGMEFPMDFGFVPQTKAEDGDPLDILVLMDEPTFPGCIVEVRLIGAIEAQQSEGETGKSERNDRLIGISTASILHKNIDHIKDLSDDVIREIEMFFVNYNQLEGRNFKLLDCGGPKRAKKLVQKMLLKRVRQVKAA